MYFWKIAQTGVLRHKIFFSIGQNKLCWTKSLTNWQSHPYTCRDSFCIFLLFFVCLFVLFFYCFLFCFFVFSFWPFCQKKKNLSFIFCFFYFFFSKSSKKWFYALWSKINQFNQISCKFHSKINISIYRVPYFISRPSFLRRGRAIDLLRSPESSLRRRTLFSSP